MAEETKTIEATADTTPKTEAPKEAPKEAPENPEIAKLKTALSRANSEAADWRRKYVENVDEQKRKELEAQEARQKELEELESLRRDKRINTYMTRLMDSGVDHTSADIMAKALPDGVSDDYFAAMKSLLSTQKQAAETAALNSQPKLSVGMPPTGVQKTEEDKKLDKIFGLAH